MRDIEVGDHVWYQARCEIDSEGWRDMVEWRAVVERVTPARITIRPYFGRGRQREYVRARAVSRWKVRPY